MSKHLTKTITNENKSKISIDLSNSFTSNEGNSCGDIVVKEEYVYHSSGSNQHLFQTNSLLNRPEEDMNSEPKDNDSENWINWVDIKEIDGKERLVCKWFNCGFESMLRIRAKKHINKHLTQKCNTNTIKDESESLLWDQILPDVTTNEEEDNWLPKSEQCMESTPKNKSMNSSKRVRNDLIESELKTEAKSESKVSQLIDIQINGFSEQNNVILSLKGMNSASKLKKYIRRQVIDGIKYYFCVYNNYCGFKCRRTQQLAIHIHTSHIGFYLKCIQPNCGKVFRNPTSWREHQKNHICNFGIYGDQKKVIGVCRTENILKYREPIILDSNEKAFRCKWKDCQRIIRHRAGIKRHIHDQHLCPYRNNNEWKKKFNNSLTKDSKIEDIPQNPMVSNGLKDKHKPNKKGLNPKTKVEKQNKDLTKNQKLKQNVEKIRKTKEQKIEVKPDLNQMKSQLNLNLNTSSDINSKCDQFIEQKVFEGIDYYLCSAIDCKFVTKLRPKIIDHILGMHSKELTPIEDREEKIAQKRRSDSIESSVMDFRKRTKSYDNCWDNSKELDRKEVIESYIEPNLYIQRFIDNEPNYFCTSIHCKYYSNDFNEIQTHIQSTHMSFKCQLQNCHREFKSKNLLEVHKRNHICGFGIKGRKSTGVCDLENIRQYRGEKFVDNRYVYPCKWLDCMFESDTKTNALSHIHNRHICPNRLSIIGLQNNY